MRILTLLLLVMFAAPVFSAPATAETSNRGVFVAGNFSSFAAAEDGSIYLLARDQKIVRLTANGEQNSIVLPPAGNSPAEFSDLTAIGGKLFFCGYRYPDIYAFDPKKPAQFSLLKTGAEATNLLNIARKGDDICVRDADFNLYHVVNGKTAVKLDKDSALESDGSGRTMIVPPPSQTGENVAASGRVYKDDGRLFWVAPTPEPPAQVMSIEFLGADKNGRSIFSVITARGELDAVYTLYAVKRGKAVASLVIPGPEGLEMQHYCRMAPDGRVLLLQADANGREGVWVKSLVLKDGEFLGRSASQG